MKSWRGSLVLALCSLFFGHSGSKAQGVYFLNTSTVTLDVYVDAWDSGGGYVQNTYLTRARCVSTSRRECPIRSDKRSRVMVMLGILRTPSKHPILIREWASWIGPIF